MTTTFVIGNGIGKALDSEYFSLETGLNSSWQSFTAEEKKIIALRNNQCPLAEDELEHQHITSTACKKLFEHKEAKFNFLSEQGECFPTIYQEFIYRTAKHFCEYTGRLPEEFIDKLCHYIKSDSPSHIATLNYDKLLYERLIEKEICKGYTGDLVDGIHNNSGIFSYENLLRITKNFGWYLHLHGSPLFRSDNGGIHKENINSHLADSYSQGNGEHVHIVLTHSKYKTDVISGSALLEVYFNFFINALSESQKIICIGYSGLDEHINFEIKKWITNSVMTNIKTQVGNQYLIEIVEWDKCGNTQDFWENALFPKFNYEKISLEDHIKLQIKHLANILEYDFNLNT